MARSSKCCASRSRDSDRLAAHDQRVRDAHRTQHQQHVARGLRDRDQNEKRPERFAQQARRDCERIADHRHPAHQQRPAAVAVIPALRLVERLRRHREPFAVAEALGKAAQQPVQAGAEDITRAGDRDQKPAARTSRSAAGPTSATSECAGQDGGRNERHREQSGIGCKIGHAGCTPFSTLLRYRAAPSPAATPVAKHACSR